VNKPLFDSVPMTPIGVVRCAQTYSYEASHQGTSSSGTTAEIELAPGCNFEQALADLQGFSHLWVLSLLHHNLGKGWKPRVRPPRAPQQSRGLFATRAPYRPNPIGMTCVRLLQISGRILSIGDHDLLDGTPVLDLKPYIVAADCFPDASCGWLSEVDAAGYRLDYSAAFAEQLHWLCANGVPCLADFLHAQLRWQPLAAQRKRICQLHQPDNWQIAYRTWRVRFVHKPNRVLYLYKLFSSYSQAQLTDTGSDRYADKCIHRAFAQRFAGISAEDVVL